MLRFTKSTCVGLFATLLMLAATPAHAQSLEDQASAQTTISYVQAPVAQEATARPMLSFQPTGEHDWHIYVDANLHAYHFDRAEAHANHYEETNLGAGLELTNDVLGVMAGYYHNSIHRGSWYVLGRYTPVQIDITSKDRVNIGLLAGILSGYEKSAMVPGFTPAFTITNMQTVWYEKPTMVPGQKPRGFMPAGGFLISYQHSDAFGLNLIFVPPVRSEGVSPFMGIQARIGLPVKLGF